MVPVNSVSMMEKRLRIMMGTIFVLLDGVFLLLLFAWLVTVSYTHLTLPTKRIV